MADMTREEAIEILSGMIVATHVKDISIGTVEEVRESLRFALSDMGKVEKLETEVEALKTDLQFHRDGYWAIDTKYKRLKDGIAKVKTEIAKSEDFVYEPNDYDILPKKVRMMRTGKVLEIINKHLGE